MGFFKKVWGGVKDVAKGISYVVASSVNSITGNEYNPRYETKAGRAIGKTLENSVDNVHTFFKNWGDRVTGGYASKLANKFRDREDWESQGNYLENSRDYGYKWLNKLNDFAGLLGGSSGRGTTGDTPERVNDPFGNVAQYSGLIKIVALFIGLYLLIGLLFKK